MKPTGRASIAPPPPPPRRSPLCALLPKPQPPAVRRLATGITVRLPSSTGAPKHSRAPVARAIARCSGGSCLAGFAKSVVVGGEVALARPADRTEPGVGDVLESG